MSFGRNLSNKYEKQLLADATKTGLDDLKTAEASGEFIANKIVDETGKSKPMAHVNSRNFEEIVIPLENRKKILCKLRQLL